MKIHEAYKCCEVVPTGDLSVTKAKLTKMLEELRWVAPGARGAYEALLARVPAATSAEIVKITKAALAVAVRHGGSPSAVTKVYRKVWAA